MKQEETPTLFYTKVTAVYTVTVIGLMLYPASWEIFKHSFVMQVITPFLSSVSSIRLLLQDWSFSPGTEFQVLVFNPGVYIGIWVGFCRVTNRPGLLAGLIPGIILAVISSSLAFLIPGGIWSALPIRQWCISTSIPYAVIGTIVGYFARRGMWSVNSDNGHNTSDQQGVM